MRKYLLHVLIISFVFLLAPTVHVASYAGELEDAKVCKKASCGEKYYKHGYCSKHYEEIFVGICRVAGCLRGKYKEGKCYNHWAGINRAVEYETVADYEIVETKFIGTRSNNRMMYKIVVEPTITREQIKPTARKIIKVITSKDKDLDEITLFLYSDKSVIGEPYDIASVDWGYPENEGRIKFNINENFEQYIKQRSKSETLFGLTEQTRRKIFKEIVLAEDRAHAEEPNATTYNLSERYKQEVRQRYNITKETEEEIINEAFRENWPTPAP